MENISTKHVQRASSLVFSSALLTSLHYLSMEEAIKKNQGEHNRNKLGLHKCEITCCPTGNYVE